MATEKTYTVTAPNDQFSGVRCGVRFKDGKGRATKAQAARLAFAGYRVPASIEDAVAEATERARQPKAATEAASDVDGEADGDGKDGDKK